MKKVIAVLMAAVFAAALLAGCAGGGQAGLTPMEQYAEFYNRNRLDSGDADIAILMDMDMGGMSLSFTIDMNVKVNLSDSENPAFYMKMGMDMGFAAAEMEQTYVDGVIYLNSDGYKIKYAMSAQEYYDQFTTAGADMFSEMAIDPESVQSVEISEENGDTVYTLVVDTETVNELFGDMLGEMTGQSGLEAAEITSQSVKIFEGDDGIIKGSTVEADMIMVIEGTETAVSYSVETVFNSVGAVTITAPADADEYALSGEDAA